MQIEILGNYRVGVKPWRLVEVRVSDVHEEIDFGGFELPVPGQPKSNWQTAYDEHVLSEDKERGEIHACFFLYVLNDELLRTPAGPVMLPPVTDRPERLDFIEFEEP